MARSADLAFRVIALQQRAVTKKRLAEALDQAERDGVPVDRILVKAGDLEAAKAAEICRVRSRYGRRCEDCSKLTFLLPKQSVDTTPCEHCGGLLSDRAPQPTGRPGPRPGGRPGAKPAGGPGPKREGPPGAKPPGAKPPGAKPPGAKPPGAKPPGAKPPGAKPPGAKPPGRPTGKPTGRPVGKPDLGGRGAGRPAAAAAAAAASRTPAGEVDVPDPNAAADADERARRLRMAGAGFGYEPQEVESKPEGRLGQAAAADDGAADGKPAGGEAADAEAADAASEAPAEEPEPDGVVIPAGEALKGHLRELLLYPARSREALALVTAGAFLVLIGRSLPRIYFAVVAVFVVYPLLYQIKITRRAMQGDDELPGWPDFDMGELAATAWRLLAVSVACFLPAFFVFVFVISGALSLKPDMPTAGLRTIGTDAYKSGGDPYLAKGTPVTGDPPFYDVDDEPVPVGGGKWTVVGLLGRDTADDTGMTDFMTNMDRGGYGVLIRPSNQIYDLERVGLALPDVRVLAAYADPDENLIASKWPWTQRDEYDDYEDDYVDEEPEVEGAFDDGSRAAKLEGVQRAMGRVPGGGAPRPGRYTPFKAVKIVKTEGFTMPAPLDQLKSYPAVVVLDPSGNVVREYSSGVHDTKLYSDLLNLRAGGDGDVWREQDLPPQALGFVPEGPGVGTYILLTLAWLAFLAAVIGGALYWPIAWLLMVAFDSPKMPFMYAAGIRAAAVGYRDYLALAGMLAGLAIGSEMVVRLLAWLLELMFPWWIQILLPIPATWIQFYVALVGAYGVGKYYHRNAEAIGWFTSRRPAEFAG